MALRPERLSLPPGFTYPNGITHAEDGTLFVGSVSSGRILRRAPGGDWTELFPGSEEVFAVTSLRLDAPRGLLWGTSPDVMGLLRPDGTLGNARTGSSRWMRAPARCGTSFPFRKAAWEKTSPWRRTAGCT